MENIKLKFYTVDRCGYYKYGENAVYLTNLEDTLDDLKEWIEDKTLAETQTTNILTAATERLPVYCIGVQKSSSGTYLLVTWNQIEDTNGRISSIPSNASIENVTDRLDSMALPDGNIAGYATYFWFVPKDNILATIKFGHIENGHVGLNYYIKGFLSRFSKHTVAVEDPENRENLKVVGYGTLTNYDEHLYPYFSSKLKRLRGNIDYIRDNYNIISKMIRKSTISQNITNDVTLFEKMMYNIGVSTPRALNDTMELKFEIKTTPTLKELNAIIDSWEQDHEQIWDDVGFTFSGNSSTPLWLSSEVPSEELEINVTKQNDEFVNFEELLTELDNNLTNFRRSYNGDD